MEPIEDQLKQAMNRVDPPDGFVARVMARVETRPAVGAKPCRKAFPPWLACWKYLTAHSVSAGAMTLAILVALGVGWGHWRQQALSPMSAQERMEGEKARDQLMLALKITGTELSRMHELLSQPPPNKSVPANKSNEPELNR